MAEEIRRESRVETTPVETQTGEIWMREIQLPAKRSLLTLKDWVAFILILIPPSILYALAMSNVELVLCFLTVLLHAMILHEMGHFLVAKHYGYRAKIELGGEAKSYGPLFSISIMRTRYWGRRIDKNEEQNIRIGGPIFNMVYGLFCLIFLWRQGLLVAAVYNLYLFFCNIGEL
ncbi:MAG: M50 family metallopeptidase [Crenarchaeota archaeon]|nr:M50 family metallopeptidase [Thermoproteota archaeon]MDW8034695.1 hypothetical protein [Nitrososphaerota archaeon]